MCYWESRKPVNLTWPEVSGENLIEVTGVGPFRKNHLPKLMQITSGVLWDLCDSVFTHPRTQTHPGTPNHFKITRLLNTRSATFFFFQSKFYNSTAHALLTEDSKRPRQPRSSSSSIFNLQNKHVSSKTHHICPFRWLRGRWSHLAASTEWQPPV